MTKQKVASRLRPFALLSWEPRKRRAGDRIRALRNGLGSSLADFAKAIRYKSAAAISDWEQGKRFPAAEALIAMHALYEKPMPWLLGELDAPEHDEGWLRRAIRVELERDARLTPALIRQVLDRSDLLEDLVAIYKADAAWEWYSVARRVKTSMRGAARKILFELPPSFIFGQPASQDLAPARVVSVKITSDTLPVASSVLHFVEMQRRFLAGDIGPFATVNFAPTRTEFGPRIKPKVRSKAEGQPSQR